MPALIIKSLMDLRERYKHKIEEQKGIIILASRGFEPFLHWWWFHYQRSENTLPVTLFNLGIDRQTKEWFHERGRVVDYHPPSFVKSFDEATPFIQKFWISEFKKFYLKFWPIRNGWFAKPLVCSLSPYKTTLYIDLDCLVLENLSPLLEPSYNFAGVKEPKDMQISFRKRGIIQKKETMINSGVLIFDSSSILLKKWVERTLNDNQSFRGDQEILSRIVFEEKIPMTYLPSRYNVLPPHCIEKNPAILHFTGMTNKKRILNDLQNLQIVDFTGYKDLC